MGNYIKLSRSLLDWGWYSDVNTSRLFIHMILRANWKDGKFRGISVERGSFISSFRKLADETSMTEREVRTAIAHLEETGEVTHRGRSKYSVFTVVNYDKYQLTDTQIDEQPTCKRHTNDMQTTTIEEGNKGNRKEGNNKNIVRFTPPDLSEVRDYCTERNNNVDPQVFFDFYSSKGWMVGKNKMKDWKAAVRTWERNRRQGMTAEGNKSVCKDMNNFEHRKYDMDSLERKLLG